MKRFKISTKKGSLKLIASFLIESKVDFEFKSAQIGTSSLIVYSKDTKDDLVDMIKEVISSNFNIQEL